MEVAIGLLASVSLSLLRRPPPRRSLLASVTTRWSRGSPTDLAFTPDGRMLITTQPGRLRVVADGALLPNKPRSTSWPRAPSARTRSAACSAWPWIRTSPRTATSTSSTFKKFGVCDVNTSQAPSTASHASRCHHRRRTRSIRPANSCSSTTSLPRRGYHNAGDVAIAADGFLYVSVGDGGCQLDDATRCAAQNDNARSLDTLLGKILRIGLDGSVPTSKSRGRRAERRPSLWRSGRRAERDGSVRRNIRVRATEPIPIRLSARNQRIPHQRRRPGDLGGDRPRSRGRRLRLECPRGRLRCGLDLGLRNPAGRHDEPDPRLRTCRRLPVDHGRCVRAGRRLALCVRQRVPVQRLHLRQDFRLVPNASGGFDQVEFATGLGGSSAVAMTFGPYGNTPGASTTPHTLAVARCGGSLRSRARIASPSRTPGRPGRRAGCRWPSP